MVRALSLSPTTIFLLFQHFSSLFLSFFHLPIYPPSFRFRFVCSSLALTHSFDSWTWQQQHLLRSLHLPPTRHRSSPARPLSECRGTCCLSAPCCTRVPTLPSQKAPNTIARPSGRRAKVWEDVRLLLQPSHLCTGAFPTS